MFSIYKLNNYTLAHILKTTTCAVRASKFKLHVAKVPYLVMLNSIIIISSATWHGCMVNSHLQTISLVAKINTNEYMRISFFHALLRMDFIMTLILYA